MTLDRRDALDTWMASLESSPSWVPDGPHALLTVAMWCPVTQLLAAVANAHAPVRFEIGRRAGTTHVWAVVAEGEWEATLRATSFRIVDDTDRPHSVSRERVEKLAELESSPKVDVEPIAHELWINPFPADAAA